MKIKKGDNVYIVKGKDRGKSGKVSSVFPQKNKILIQELNQYKKSIKPKKEGEKGRTVLISMPISTPNVKIICPKCGQKTRVGFKFEGENKLRNCKKCDSNFK
ncbi:MAG: 50S ribosomal protein L24 [Candidatus Liptonbacteria bacterium]|nr:50S ribosomal protein L24 [Candidatus Liptonbacteria bacterium]